MDNIKWHNHSISREQKELLHGHKGATLWFTGLSGSGKSTMANATAGFLHDMKVSTYVLDGDNIRHGLNSNLSFSIEDRRENTRRIAQVARLFTDAAIVNLTAFISPFREERQIARDMQPDSFIEIYCSANISDCEKRDPKGLYKKARMGEINDFTGIDSPYEAPQNPELIIDTANWTIEKGVFEVIEYLRKRAIVK